MTRFFLLVIACFLLFLNSIAQSEEQAFHRGQIIVKIKPEHAKSCKANKIKIKSIELLLKSLNISRVEKLFPNHKSILSYKKVRKDLVDISTIYRFHFDKTFNHQKLIRQLKKNDAIEYAENEFINRLAFSPNDTLNSRQWHLAAIKAFEAWDIERGDTNVVIAIIDTGSDMDHEDLKDNYALNHDDPINGLDDDNDGYVDNFNGWDIANDDNDPGFSNTAHGANVASIAGASTNNVTGISGVGFNSRIMIVRIDDKNTGELTASFQGVVYAADQGAFIINNSWGSYSSSQLGQDIINYAAINKGALVIAATGNGPFSGPNAGIGIEAPFYPAAYDNVLSVGALIEGDTIKESSNYGYWADIFAPGENMLVASGMGMYGINGGTSMASPVVAGVAALIKSLYPDYTANQVAQTLLATADNVDSVNEDRFRGKLGVGRVNALRALTETNSPGVDFNNRRISDNNDGIFSRGDSLFIWGNFINYLASASGVVASLRTVGDRLTIIDGRTELGTLNTLDSTNNENDPFIVLIEPGTRFNEEVVFEVNISANGSNYNRKVYFNLDLNPDFLTIKENDLTVTLTSNGSIGFSGNDNTLGQGIKYQEGNSLLFDGSFLVGNTGNYIPNAYRGLNGEIERNFKTLVPITIKKPESSDFESQTIFSDINDSELNSLLEIEQTNFAFKEGLASSSIIYTYNIKNTSLLELKNLYAGLIIDWDIEDFSTNKITYNPEQKMGISFSTDTNLFVGVKVLNEEMGSFHYAIDNTQDGNGGVNITDGISDEEKFLIISSNRAAAGNVNPTGNDIVDANSVGPFDLGPNGNQLVSFAIIVSDSRSELRKTADTISSLFNKLLLTLPKSIPNASETVNVFPNPSNESVSVGFSINTSRELNVQIFDIHGKLILENPKRFYSSGRHQISLNTSSWKTGVYLLKISGNNFNKRNNFVVLH